MQRVETSQKHERALMQARNPLQARDGTGRRLLSFSQEDEADRISLLPVSNHTSSAESSNETVSKTICREPEPERVECELGPVVEADEWRTSTWRLVWVAVDNPQLFADPPAPTPLGPNTLGLDAFQLAHSESSHLLHAPIVGH